MRKKEGARKSAKRGGGAHPTKFGTKSPIKKEK